MVLRRCSKVSITSCNVLYYTETAPEANSISSNNDFTNEMIGRNYVCTDNYC